MDLLNYPFDAEYILRKKKAIKKQILKSNTFIEKKIAILSGSTVGEIKDILEIFLLKYGIKPVFLVGDYNRFYEDIIFDNPSLLEFKPDIIYIHTSNRNIVEDEMNSEQKFRSVWNKIKTNFKCPIIQNNFELPLYRVLGNRDAVDLSGKINKINSLNQTFYEYARETKDFYINDINYLSAYYGLEKWLDPTYWYMYKYALNVNAIPLLSHNIAKIIKSIFGKNQKCLVLDLDNTLWGGIVGEVGSDGIELSMESAMGEAYIDFQQYVKALHRLGIVLAICSKNEELTAKKAFDNKNMVLKLEDIQEFCANWNIKSENVESIARNINISTDSIVFVDDNEAEQELVKKNIPDVKVPNVRTVTDYIQYIDFEGYFEPAALSDDDRLRNSYYQLDKKRTSIQKEYENYSDYLIALNMTARFSPFVQVHLDRITQLINKTNQFNLTTQRYSFSEVEGIANNDNYVTLYATLEDKFGNNGIVTAFIGEKDGSTLHVRLWIMSCRVFKRNLELALLDHLIEVCRAEQINKIIGYYYKTGKNSFVDSLYSELGFNIINEVMSEFLINEDYEYKNTVIKVKDGNDS